MPQSPSEEIANATTHGLGLLLSIAATAVLMVVCLGHGSKWAVGGCGVYSVCLVAVYAASTLSHALQNPQRKRFFAILDQAVIFLLIAGTYTPFGMEYLREGWWWLLTAAIWSVALWGFFHKLVWTNRRELTSVTIYVVLGWLPAVALEQLLPVVPAAALGWMVAGGLWYTVGTVFLVRDEKVRYFHVVWHVFVIAGSVCHYVGILLFVAGGTDDFAQ